MEDDLRSTHKGVVPMATGASCPRRPKGGRGKTERGGGRGGLGELRKQAEVRVLSHTHTHGVPLQYFTGSKKCLCVCLCLCVYVGVRMCRKEWDVSPQTILFSSKAILFDMLSNFFVSACRASSTFFWNFTRESHSQGSSS